MCPYHRILFVPLNQYGLHYLARRCLIVFQAFVKTDIGLFTFFCPIHLIANKDIMFVFLVSHPDPRQPRNSTEQHIQAYFSFTEPQAFIFPAIPLPLFQILPSSLPTSKSFQKYWFCVSPLMILTKLFWLIFFLQYSCLLQTAPILKLG